MSNISIIVVTLSEDPSMIPSVQILRDQGHEFELIIRRDDGIATARNRGIHQATNDSVIFLDDDAIPCDDFIPRAKKALDVYPVITGRVLQPDSDIRPKDTTLYDRGMEINTVDHLIGCNMGFRKEVFEKAGYFDERFKWGHEEWEFSSRVREHYDIYYCPDLVVTHPFAESYYEYMKKEYLKGISDVKLWSIEDVPYYKRMIRCSPLLRPQGDMLETIGRVPRKIGRLRRLVSQAIHS